MPSAPQITGMRSPIAVARRFAGLRSLGVSPRRVSTSSVRMSSVSSTSGSNGGRSPIRSSAPSTPNAKYPRETRGISRPEGISTIGSFRSALLLRSAPPEAIERMRHPRATASSKQASVSAVSPEYDEATTSVCGPQNSGSSGPRMTSTGIRIRSRNSARRISPACAELPMAQNATDEIPSPDGSRSVARPSAYPSPQSFGRRSIAPSIPEGSPYRSERASSRFTGPAGRPRPRLRGVPRLLGLVDQHDRDGLAHRLAVAALGTHDDGLPLVVLDG